MWEDVLHHVVGEHEWSDGQCSHSPLILSDTDKPLLGKGSQGNRSPNKGHIGQEMARKFGPLCLVQVSNFFLQVAKIYEFSIPLLKIHKSPQIGKQLLDLHIK